MSELELKEFVELFEFCKFFNSINSSSDNLGLAAAVGKKKLHWR
jgi:hypothetical protein